MNESGTDLARSFYLEVVLPIVDARWPGLPHAAARLGSGSDVLGLDDETSRDHDWGLRLNLLVDQAMVAAVDEVLSDALPAQHHGLPVRFPVTWDPEARHRVQLDAPADFLRSRLGFDPREHLTIGDWLSLTSQSILEVTAGAVFADSDGALTQARERLRWYPHDVWLYVVAAEWRRIGQEIHLMGRASQRGDDVGERVLGARLANNALRLGFLLERSWAPYPKWIGPAFARLPRAGAIAPALERCVSASTREERQAGLVQGLEALHDLQRAVGLPTGRVVVEPFWDRPYVGISEIVVELLLAAIEEPALRRPPEGVFGSVDQWSDNVDLLTDPIRRISVSDRLYELG